MINATIAQRTDAIRLRSGIIAKPRIAARIPVTGVLEAQQKMIARDDSVPQIAKTREKPFDNSCEANNGKIAAQKQPAITGCAYAP